MSVEKFIEDLKDAQKQNAISEFSVDRYQTLVSGAEPYHEVGLLGTMVTDFTHPDTVNSTGFGSTGFRIDSIKPFTKFSETLANGLHVRPNDEPEDLILQSALMTMFAYFGNRADNRVRDTAQASRQIRRKDAISLDQIAEKGSALCAERSLLSHNLCYFAGLKSASIRGRAGKGSEASIGHEFQVVSIDSDHFIFDVMLIGSRRVKEKLRPIQTKVPISLEQFVKNHQTVSSSIDTIHEGVQKVSWVYNAGYPSSPQEIAQLPKRKIVNAVLGKIIAPAPHLTPGDAAYSRLLASGF